MNSKTVFDSAFESWNPQLIPPVPLFRLPSRLVPFPSTDRVRIYAQAAYLWPLGNLKHPTVFHMLQKACKRGELDYIRTHTIIDSSSGNTTYCIANFCRHWKKKAVLFVPADMPKTKEDRLRSLEDLGVTITLVKCRELPGTASAMELAKQQGQEKGCFYLNQYENPDNIEGHILYHVKPAWQQTNDKMAVYAGSLGSCGHIGAALKFFQNTTVAVVAAYCAENNPLPGMRTLRRLASVPLAKSCLDPEENQQIYRFPVYQHEAYRSSWELAIAGIEAGPSSGAAKVALDKFLTEQRKNPEAWEKMRNRNGYVDAVFMCGDRFDLYSAEKYRQVLDACQIPAAPDYQI